MRGYFNDGGKPYGTETFRAAHCHTHGRNPSVGGRGLKAKPENVYPDRNHLGRIFLEKKSRPALLPLDTVTLVLLEWQCF